MGAFDGAEICQLIGQYMLFLLSQEIPYEQMILYRDDGLGYIHGSGPTADRNRKKIMNIFKSKNLNITMEVNLKKTEFLDVFLDLDTGLHRSFFKPNNELRYVSVHSNHPPHIKNQIPKMISERISHLSSNKIIFESDFAKYYDALQNSGYSFSPEYIEKPQSQKGRKRTRKRKIIWYNPPWNESVSTNIGASFLKNLDKNFPKGSNLHKLFNRNNVKVTYGCLPNMQCIINKHNSKLLKREKSNNCTRSNCTCRAGINSCPLGGKCTTQSVIYKAEVHTNISPNINTTNPPMKTYIGATENEWKSRYNMHKSSFKHKHLEHTTSLSRYIWSLKDSNTPYELKWDILKPAPTYSKEARTCRLCIEEKTAILFGDKGTLLNKRAEIMNKCKHNSKHKLSALRTITSSTSCPG